MANCKQCGKKLEILRNTKKMYCGYECSKKYWQDVRGIERSKASLIYSSTYFDWRDYPNGIV